MKYSVVLPIAGHLAIEVEADSKEGAIQKAMDIATLTDIEGWEYYEHSEGNVNSFPSPLYPEVEPSK